MALLWFWHRRLGNARLVDAGWAGIIAALAIADARLGAGFGPRRAAIAFMMGSWGLRLMIHQLYGRVFGRNEDGRFAARRARWGDRASTKFFWFFQAQALLAVVFSLPALLSSTNGTPAFSSLELSAAGLWIAAYAGETTADRQLLHFNVNEANRGRTCQVGLWRYSRHPDYFFEWLIWVAYALFAFAAPWGPLALVCPAARAYQLTTRPFVAWLRKYRRAS